MWKYTDESKLVVIRTLPDGSAESCLSSRQDVVDYIKNGGVIIPCGDLDGLKKRRLMMLQQDVSPGYIYQRYDAGTQATFTALTTYYTYLISSATTNPALIPVLQDKIVKCLSVLSWVSSVLGSVSAPNSYYGKKDAIMKAATEAELSAITWDFPAMFDGIDPKVTIPMVSM